MIYYTAGIRKILEPPKMFKGNRDEFLRIAFDNGYKLAAWNGEVFLITLEYISNTGLMISDFAFGSSDEI